jgi:mono/diheme cytochrome c family protein
MSVLIAFWSPWLPAERAVQMRRLLTIVWVAAVVLAVLNVAPASAQTRRTVWDRVFTTAQAERGKAIFGTTCASCHAADLSGGRGPELRGETFRNHWMEGSLDRLFARVKSMPPNGANLGSAESIDVLAYLLDVNDFPAGAQELKAEAVPDIQIQGKDGPAPVPNFALVQVVGCFARGPNDTWMLSSGSEPVRTGSPTQSTESEIAAARAKPLGSQTFELMDVEYFSNAFHPDTHAGNKVNAKGFLIRSRSDSKINVTWIEMLAADCVR